MNAFVELESNAILPKTNCMATIIPSPLGKSNAKRHAVKIDMTPMVDLGFLLISFFIFTTTLTQPTTTKLTMPKADPNTTLDVYEPTLFTVIVDREKAFVYEGGFKKAAVQNKLIKTNYNIRTGLGEAIRQKQKALAKEGQKDDLMVVIKPTPSASYQELINVLDEMLINGVKHYAVVDASTAEKDYLAAHH